MSRLARIAAALNPRRTFFGPIFDKEMRVAGRRLGTYVLRGLYAMALLGIVAIVLVSATRPDLGSDPGSRLRMLQQVAPMIALAVVWIQFAALALAAPLLTGGALSEERTRGTLSALLTTPLTAAQIVGGKLASSLAQLVVLAALATPVLLALRLFGGFDARLIVAAAGVSFSTAVLGAALGLFFSLRHKSAAISTLFGIMSLITIQFAPIAAIMFPLHVLADLGYTKIDKSETFFSFIATSPPFALGVEAARSLGDTEAHVNVLIPWGGGVLHIAPVWVVNVGWNLLLAAGVLAITVRGLRRAMTSDGPARATAANGTTALTPDQPPAEPGTNDTPPPAKAARRSRAQRKSREVGDDPILWRELRTYPFGSRDMLIVAVLTAIMVHAFLYWYPAIEDEDLLITLAIVGTLGVMLQATFTGTLAYASERQRRTWDTLLTTPIPPARIVIHKWLSTIASLWFFPTIILTHQLLMVLAGQLSWFVPVHTVMILGGPVLLLASTGNALGLAIRRSSVAQISNLGLAVGLWIALPAVAEWMLSITWDSVGRPPTYATIALRLNPMLIGLAVEGGSTGIGRDAGTYNVPGGSTGLRTLSAGTFTLWLLPALAGYLLASAATLALVIWRFNRLAPRAR